MRTSSSETESPTRSLLDDLAITTVEVNEKPWGREVDISSQHADIQLKIITYFDGKRTSLQVHDRKDELLIPIKTYQVGDGLIEVDGRRLRPKIGDHIRVLPGAVHRVTGPLICLEVSTYEPNDIRRLEDDFGRVTT